MKLTANQIDVQVGQRMRLRREFYRISQGHLGRQLGLTFSQVQKYEKGINRIGAGRLYLIAEFLGVPVQYFYECTGEENVTEATPTRARCNGQEIAALGEAFCSIDDPDIRRSVLALVRSLAAEALPSSTNGQNFRAYPALPEAAGITDEINPRS